MKTLACLIALTSVMAGTAIAQNAQNTIPQSDSSRPPQGSGAATIPGNRDPGAEAVVVPSDNPGTTSVNRSAVEAPATSNQTSDRITSQEWQGLGSTGGSTGTGTSSGTTADEAAPAQNGNQPDNPGASNGDSQDSQATTSDAPANRRPARPRE